MLPVIQRDLHGLASHSIGQLRDVKQRVRHVLSRGGQQRCQHGGWSAGQIRSHACVDLRKTQPLWQTLNTSYHSKYA